MNKYYVFHGHFSPEREIIHAKMMEDLDNDEEVEVVYCQGSSGCPNNPLGIGAYCKSCTRMNDRLFDDVYRRSDKSSKLTKRYINFEDDRSQRIDIENIGNLKDVSYKGKDSGYAVLSTYIGLTRDFSPDPGHFLTKMVLKNLHQNFCSVYDFVKSDLNAERKNLVENVYVYNGRLANNRAVVRACQDKNVTVRCLEHVGQSNKFIYFENTLPHDIKFNRKLIDKVYRKYERDAEQIANSFYKQKAKGKNDNDKVYVGKQSENVLPKSWVNNEGRRIVIFSSSEDEFKAIGKEWEGGVYQDQIAGIIGVCESSRESDRVYLRVHPNVQGASDKYKKEILSLTHPRLEVIPPDSKVSSYAMLFGASIVVVFGSSIGVESAYWGKPTILLGNCFYKSLGGCYTPNTRDELCNLLKSENIAPMNSDMPLKMAVYWTMNGEFLEGFSGNKKNGYLLDGSVKRKDPLDTLIYYFTKAITKVFLRFCK